MNTSIFYKPAVGKDYKSGGIFGKKIMVLGESHYCGEHCADCGIFNNHPECAAFTNGVVKNYLDVNYPRERWMNTFVKFERSLVGHYTDVGERKRIWQSVLFFNFLQIAMDKPRQAGKDKQYKIAGDAFYEVLDMYRPQYVIVWGYRLWRHLPNDKRWHAAEKPIVIDDYEIKSGNYVLSSGGTTRIMAVYHPSGGYSWDWWHRAIKEFLQ